MESHPLEDGAPAQPDDDAAAAQVAGSGHEPDSQHEPDSPHEPDSQHETGDQPEHGHASKHGPHTESKAPSKRSTLLHGRRLLAAAIACALIIAVGAVALIHLRTSEPELLGEVSTDQLPGVSARLVDDQWDVVAPDDWEVLAPDELSDSYTYNVVTSVGPAFVLAEYFWDSEEKQWDSTERIVQFDTDGDVVWNRTLGNTVADYYSTSHNAVYRANRTRVTGPLQSDGEHLVLRSRYIRHDDGTASTPVVVLEARSGRTVLETEVDGAAVAMVLLDDAVAVQTIDGTTARAGGTITVLPFRGGNISSWHSDEWLAGSTGETLILTDVFGLVESDSITTETSLWPNGTASAHTVYPDGSDALGPWQDVAKVGSDGLLTIGYVKDQQTIVDARTGQVAAQQEEAQ
ncbi:hypothetical protein [Actinobaculum sp. 352]|uniref:hypothetical protein n=1 Tax=Actinobaculum sp. 352 TaxID=2490946 RepID=UPI000F7E4DB7|nr:hypothetical protein [Actinobaculum sp. 352]RTE49198.1 hypothetical protein EKN07_06370 [Actinobaculum sp. 352]